MFQYPHCKSKSLLPLHQLTNFHTPSHANSLTVTLVYACRLTFIWSFILLYTGWSRLHGPIDISPNTFRCKDLFLLLFAAGDIINLCYQWPDISRYHDASWAKAQGESGASTIRSKRAGHRNHRDYGRMWCRISSANGWKPPGDAGVSFENGGQERISPSRTHRRGTTDPDTGTSDEAGFGYIRYALDDHLVRLQDWVHFGWLFNTLYIPCGVFGIEIHSVLFDYYFSRSSLLYTFDSSCLIGGICMVFVFRCVVWLVIPLANSKCFEFPDHVMGLGLFVLVSITRYTPVSLFTHCYRSHCWTTSYATT